MRIPETFTRAVCFLAVESIESDNVKRVYGGTAFFVGVPSVAVKDEWHLFLVTAKHCIVEAGKRPGKLCARLNVAGGAELVDATDWLQHDDPAVDLAITAFDYEGEVEHSFIPIDALVDNAVMIEEDIGPGDDVVVPGLFTYVYGLKRNHPVLRTGIISAIPDEALEDSITGFSYRGILLEMKSFGGLSGSPVLVFLEKGVSPNTPRRFLSQFVHRPAVVGVIRAHWDYRSSDVVVDFASAESEKSINMGIAVATPAHYILEMLQYEQILKFQREQDRRWLADGAEPA